ncbi:CRISPR-associated endonuclease Cas2 [Propionibacterium freudenreichii]|uniref:CRISPR-associated endonuclease Cas2 n=1 Tax=Propionibacterium freudenreichii TaxID=1744 RepID=UPI00255188CE|nr:CRISPR-associated endonuclease Cas2 [Propionibacterium freudenreichii]MDK9321018.1 CRISPR-associated endonuclease Cas2 [Propionibacterium freudenreichii]MDK9323425.1 CRISPR-associated endonuclease Cas2 [Propionibacterium freudenreichii]
MSRRDSHCFLIAYDVPDDRRRTRLATVLKGYGERVQYSVFMVDCPPSHLLILRHDLTATMNPIEDSVVICDLGMSSSADAQRITWLGGKRYESGGRSIII